MRRIEWMKGIPDTRLTGLWSSSTSLIHPLKKMYKKCDFDKKFYYNLQALQLKGHFKLSFTVPLNHV